MTSRSRFLAALACVSFAVIACGGTSGTSPAPRALRAATVTFTLRWPDAAVSPRGNRLRGGAHERRPRFISPSAKSVVIEINAGSSPAGPVTFANNPSTNGAPATSTVSIDAPPGNDVFSIAVFDQPQTPGETAPVGNQIGRAEVTKTIASGAANTLDAVISGIVGSVRIAPAPNQPFVETLSAAPPQSYALVGDQPQTFIVTTLDPDGNVIVPVDTSPARVDTPLVSLAASAATSELVVAPVAGDPSRFVVTAAKPKRSPGTVLALLASASDGAGVRAQSNVAIEERSAVYVTYAAGAASTVAVYDDRGNAIALPAGAFAGLTSPGAIAYDADDRRVFVADAGRLVAFDASGNPVSGYAPPAAAGANGIAYDANNKLLYVSAPGTVSAFTPAGVPPAALAAPFVAPNAASIAYVPGAPPQLAVGNASPSAPSFDLYREDGTPVASRPLGTTAPPLALAFESITRTIYVATGRGIASFALGGTPGPSVADAGAPFALAFDDDLGELHAVERTPGAVAAYLPDLSRIDPAHGINAPSGSNPKGVAVAF
ncbi:MAG: hypothetical protein NVS3B7_04120 [Candidatus Elarobacter sp.]